ncbi:hypothetical protein FJY69_04335 [candidate division WOR-3 bacterium]|nr:hypothetical protein [candidate division WOR-3 bacterium]
MSVKDSCEVRCPSCSHEEQVEVWRSMNTGQDPDAKELLLAHQVNVFRCPSCGYESLIDIDFLYHDPEQGFCVQFYPFDQLADDNFLASFDLEGRPAVDLPGHFQVPDSMAYLTRPHIVFDMAELVRYVAFRDRLHGLAGAEPG